MIDQLISDFPEQTVISIGEQVANQAGFESKVKTCRELMDTLRSDRDVPVKGSESVVEPLRELLAPEIEFSSESSGRRLQRSSSPKETREEHQKGSKRPGQHVRSPGGRSTGRSWFTRRRA